MAVVIETTLGDITVDLFLKERPRACQNFLKLCKLKYYNYNLFHTVSRGFIAQTGDPTGSRTGGESAFGVLEGPLKRFFVAETNPRIKHTIMGLISFVGNDENMIGSQFFFTLADELIYLDEKHCVFGQVTEGLDVLELINEAICDSDDRPYQDIRITHTVVLDDPLPDLKGMIIPSRSPSPSAERLQGGRIAPDEEIDETAGKSIQEINEIIAEREAKARATILEMVGDLPDAEMAPPENVLFVCKLNPVTTDDDLEIIFSRFGKIKSCEVIRDHKTGDSLQYAFVEFEEQKSCEDAFFKMDNVLIDDRRIHVDFSQSVSKIKWMGKGRGVKHFHEKGNTTKSRNKESRSSSPEVKKKNDRKHSRSSNDDNRKSYDKEYRRNSNFRYKKHDRDHRDRSPRSQRYSKMRPDSGDRRSRSVSPHRTKYESRYSESNRNRKSEKVSYSQSTKRTEDRVKNKHTDKKPRKARSSSGSSSERKSNRNKIKNSSKTRQRDSSSSVSPDRRKSRKDAVKKKRRSSSSSSSEKSYKKQSMKHNKKENDKYSKAKLSSKDYRKKTDERNFKKSRKLSRSPHRSRKIGKTKRSKSSSNESS